MNGRVYDPATAMFFSPDPYIQESDNWLNYNRYSYCFGNPFRYTDPSGEFLWIIPAVAAIRGSYSGYKVGQAAGATGWNMVGYIAGGALIGAASGGAAAGFSALGAGAIGSGAVGGAIGNAGFSGLASNWNAETMVKGAVYGGLAGAAGATVGASIGGGWGALVGGSTANLTGQLLNNPDFRELNWGSVLMSGISSYAMYEAVSFMQWKYFGGHTMGNHELSYNQFKTIQADYQRSRFFRNEYGGFLMNDGSVQRFPSEWRHSHGITPSDGSAINIPEGAYASYHTHWDVGGKTIYIDSYGEQVYVDGMNAEEFVNSGAKEVMTTLDHSPTDFNSKDSYVINRFGTSYNIGGTPNIQSGYDSFMRLFPYFNVPYKKRK